MSRRMLRWGILGVAKINERLIPAFAKARNAKLVAIASRSSERARQAAASAKIPTAHGSYEALLDDQAVDAIYIPLPNTLHAEWTREAAQRGKHVLCEKPLTPTALAARELVEFCRARNVQVMDGFMWPHHPRTARIRKLLDDGRLGELRHVAGAFTFVLETLEPSNIRLRPDLGGGSLLDIGCYPVYGIRWALRQEPVRAYATAVCKHGVDVEMSGLLEFAGGQTGVFDCGFTQPLRGWLEITGSEGVLTVPDMWLPAPRATFRLQSSDGRIEEFVIEGEDQIVHMIDDFSSAVFDGVPARPSADEAILTLRALDALAQSAREGRPVALA